MANYRRARIPDATYFFTVTLRHRHQDWLPAHFDLLRSLIRRVPAGYIRRPPGRPRIALRFIRATLAG